MRKIDEQEAALEMKNVTSFDGEKYLLNWGGALLITTGPSCACGCWAVFYHLLDDLDIKEGLSCQK